MTFFVFVLVLLSASLHVLWNTLVKQSEDKPSFAVLTTLMATLALVPVFIASRVVQPGPLSPAAWSWAALSGLLEALYLVLLFGAYGRADLSVVYPLSRGVAPLVTLVLGGRLLAGPYACAVVDAWLAAEFQGGRHQNRLDLIRDLERHPR